MGRELSCSDAVVNSIRKVFKSHEIMKLIHY